MDKSRLLALVKQIAKGDQALEQLWKLINPSGTVLDLEKSSIEKSAAGISALDAVSLLEESAPSCPSVVSPELLDSKRISVAGKKNVEPRKPFRDRTLKKLVYDMFNDNPTESYTFLQVLCSFPDMKRVSIAATLSDLVLSGYLVRVKKATYQRVH